MKIPVLFLILICLSLSLADEQHTAIELYNKHEYAKALNLFNNVYKENENTLTAFYILKTLIKMDRYDEAIKQADIFLEKYGDEPILLFQKARVLYFKGNYQEAQHILEKAIIKKSTNPHYFNLLGLCYIQNKKYKDAVLMENIAISLDDTVKEFHNNLGIAYEHLKEYKKSMTAYMNAISLDPAYENANENYDRIKQILNSKN